jgi:predicted nucleic acid-binding protein
MDRGEAANTRARSILSCNEPLITTDHILVETWMLLRSRAQRKIADQFWATLRHGITTIETVTPADLEAAWEIGLTYADQDFSMVDRTSFAVMRRLGVERVASFDHHFAIFRFGPDRRRAFTLLH